MRKKSAHSLSHHPSLIKCQILPFYKNTDTKDNMKALCLTERGFTTGFLSPYRDLSLSSCLCSSPPFAAQLELSGSDVSLPVHHVPCSSSALHTKRLQHMQKREVAPLGPRSLIVFPSKGSTHVKTITAPAISCLPSFLDDPLLAKLVGYREIGGFPCD